MNKIGVIGVVILAALVGSGAVFATGLLETSSSVEDEGPDFEPPDPETTPGELSADHNEFAEFQDIASEVGLDYETESSVPTFVRSHGVYVADIDNDGYEDLLLIGGEKPTLFENTDSGYEESTVFDHPQATVAHFFDYNNNGYRDLIFGIKGESPVLYENVGGVFVERDVGLDQPLDYPTTITAADVTDNGCLDIYIGQWGAILGDPAVTMDQAQTVAADHPDVRPTTENGSSNYLFQGDCNEFEDITDEAAVGGGQFTLAVSAADVTGDRNVDLHVANDWTADYLHRNEGGGAFEKVDMGPDSDRNAMSSVAMDVTGNHHLDLFVTNVYFDEREPVEEIVPLVRTPLPLGNNLFVNDGSGEFTDTAPEHGLENGAWGWAATVADYTNDGHLDIIHASSYTDLQVVDNYPEIFKPPQIWKGTSTSWEKVDGFDVGFDHHDTRGIARVDHQNNGVLDLAFVGQPAATLQATGDEPRAFLYENQHENNASLQFFVRNPNGLERNSEVYIETDERTIYRVANGRGDLLSQDSRLIHLGMANEDVEQVTILWPDETVTEYDFLEEGNRYVLTPDGTERID